MSVLTPIEKDSMKLMKKIREVEKLKEQECEGMQLDPKQVEKISTHVGLLHELVGIWGKLPDESDTKAKARAILESNSVPLPNVKTQDMQSSFEPADVDADKVVRKAEVENLENMQPSNATVQADASSLTPLEKETMKLMKKIREIEKLKDRASEGMPLDSKQREKLAMKNSLVSDLANLWAQLPDDSDTKAKAEPILNDNGFPTSTAQWQDDQIGVEDLAPAKAKEKPEFEIIENVQPYGTSVQSDPNMQEILKVIKELSGDEFGENALDMVTRKKGWKMTLLVHNEKCGATDAASETKHIGENSISSCLDAPEEAEAPPLLIGFIVYRIRPEFQSISIAKVAVVPQHRGNGHGGQLMDWAKAAAKKQSEICYICLSSLPAAVRFYSKIGFKAVDVSTLSPECREHEQLVEGQVYMEFQVRKGSKNKKK